MSDAEGLRRALALLASREKGSRQADLQDLAGQAAGPGARRLTAWTSGVLRHRRTLGVVLGAVAKRALKKGTPLAVAALELFGYRLLFGGEPREALLVELEGIGEGKKAREHVARVLAALEGAIAERVAWTPAAEADDALLPLSRSDAVRFARPLLGASRRGPAGRLGVLYSLPDELVAAWIAAHGEERAAELCRAANDPPPLFARVNRLRASAGELSAELAAAGVEALATELATGLRLGEGRGAFRHTDAWRRGAFSIQDLTAQRVAPLLAPAPGERVLDLCAAPGGKATHLAELADDRADLLACDVKPARLRKVEGGARRLGLSCLRTRRVDGRHATSDLADEAPFEAVLVDAPCSNTGVLRRRPEARWRYDRKSQQRLARQQADILAQAARLVAPGGRLVYSVCSIEPEEGSEQLRALVEGAGHLELEHEELWLPSPEGGDGGYAGRVLRRGS